ncbi:MAG: efflux RND transporter permease subunit [Gemmataceae bacterium]
MNPIVYALRHPYAVMVSVVAICLTSAIVVKYRAKIDVFPNLNQPVLYICQPYGGMNPGQMEGLLTNYYEFHFLYVNGIHHVESKNIQGMTLIKCYFHPGTDMAQATAETVAAVNRSRFMMPPGTVPPFLMRLDVGSALVGYLVLSSDKLAIKDIQDTATLKVRPLFAGIPGVSTPPAFGGNQRAIVVNIDQSKLLSQHLTLEQVTTAVANGNVVSPSGNVRVGDRNFLVESNVMVGTEPIRELGEIPVKSGPNPVFLKDIATVRDDQDITAGYALVDGRRSVYMLVTKRSEASTIDVVNRLKTALPRMRENAPGVDIRFEFDQSTIVTEAVYGVVTEGVIGAILTGLMVLLFLRDWRSVLVVVLNIPVALVAALLALWACGQTINLMSLGGLALAVGILVDEATVEVENIHTQLGKSTNVARAVRLGNQETAVPRLLAMLCILAVFIPAFFMQGAARELFVPLSMAVGFSMIASYLLSSTFVPILAVWLLRMESHHEPGRLFVALQNLYEAVLARLVWLRWFIVPSYFVGAGLLLAVLYSWLGTAIFPPADKGQFQLRIKAPTGTRVERTEELTRFAVDEIAQITGAGKVRTTVAYVGMFPTNYPVQGCYQWTSGPEESILKVALTEKSGIRVEELKEKLRTELPGRLQGWLKKNWEADGVPAEQREQRAAGLRLSFEPGDLVNEVTSLGSPSAIEVHVSGQKMDLTLPFAKKVLAELQKIPQLRDLQMAEPQDYPTIEMTFDREKAGTMGLAARDLAAALVPATASSRYVMPIYWRDKGSGQAYIVQVQIPPPNMTSPADVASIPVRTVESGDDVLVRDLVKSIRETTTPGQVDRYNMRRSISLTANIASPNLGAIRKAVETAVKNVGAPPVGVDVTIRGQLELLDQVLNNLIVGLVVAVLAVAFMLTAYFQSVRLMLTALSSLPAALVGIGLALLLTSTTLNLQSFMGAIMAMGVAVANAILLVTFAERDRRRHGMAVKAAVEGGRSRLRPILMTSAAMIAGMIPMSLGISEGGDQTAPLGRAVVGGLAMATLATLLIVPCAFAVLMRRASVASSSLDPDDPSGRNYDHDTVNLYPAVDSQSTGHIFNDQ